MSITLQTIESLPFVSEATENTTLVGWDGQKTIRVAFDGGSAGGSSFPSSEEFDQTIMEQSKIIYQGAASNFETFTPSYSGSVSAYYTAYSFPNNYIDASEIVDGDMYTVYLGSDVYEVQANKSRDKYYLEFGEEGWSGSQYFSCILKNTTNSFAYRLSEIGIINQYSAADLVIVRNEHPAAFKNSVDGKIYNLKRNSTTGAVAAFEASTN